MYRSHSTSSMFAGSLLEVNPQTTPIWDDTGSGRSNPHDGFSQPELRSRKPEISGSTINTLTSALTGSKMATTVQMPTSGGGQRPLPKALQPKTARTATPAGVATPPAMGGTVFGPQKSINDSRRGSFSCTPNNQFIKPPTPSPASNGWSGGRPQSASTSKSVVRNSVSDFSSPLTLGSSANDLEKRPSRLHSTNLTPVNWSSALSRPVRRREPVVQDSIYPMLRAALGKDKDTEDKRTEDEIVRQMFGRSSKILSTGATNPSSSSPLQLSPMSSPRNLYSSVDDVFVTSSSLTSAGSGIPPHNHTKSRSEIVTTSRQQDCLSPSQIRRPMSRGKVPDYLRHSYNVLTTLKSPELSRSQDSPLLLHHPPPPLPQNPPPPEFQDEDPFVNHLLSSRVVSCENLCRAPVSVEPRKVIRNPRSSRSKVTTPNGLSNGSSLQLFFGETFPVNSFPLLAGVDRDLLDGEVEFVGASRSSRLQPRETGSSVVQNHDDQRFHPTADEDQFHSVPDRSRAPGESLPPPPPGFRDTGSSSLLHRSTTSSTTPTTTTGGPFGGLSISHQATDSINTEDSGLDRWEKDGNDHSADEMEGPIDPAMTSVVGRERGSMVKDRGGRNWREDQSEGRGSLSSSPRPHGMDEHLCFTPKDNVSPPSGRNFVDDNSVLPNSILNQLLAENSRQMSQNTTHHHHHQQHPHHHPDNYYRLDDVEASTEEEDSRRNGDTGYHFSSFPIPPPEFDSHVSTCLPPPEFDCQSSASAGGGIDSESSHSFSTAVPSTIAVSEDTIGTPDPRSSNDGFFVDLSRSEPIEQFPPAPSSFASDYLVADLQRDIEKVVSKSGVMAGEERSSRADPEPVGPVERRFEAVDGTGMGRELVVEIVKGPVGVGFCLEGGRGSLAGDRPIIVKRIFKGGLVDGLADLCPGDELLSVGGQSLAGYSHYDAWKFIKALPNGLVQVKIRRKAGIYLE